MLLFKMFIYRFLFNKLVNNLSLSSRCCKCLISIIKGIDKVAVVLHFNIFMLLTNNNNNNYSLVVLSFLELTFPEMLGL